MYTAKNENKSVFQKKLPFAKPPTGFIQRSSDSSFMKGKHCLPKLITSAQSHEIENNKTFHISVTSNYFHSWNLSNLSGISMSLSPPTTNLTQTLFNTPYTIWISKCDTLWLTEAFITWANFMAAAFFKLFRCWRSFFI